MTVEEKKERPCVGVGVMIVRDGKMLLGKRLGAHGSGQYAFPGGHLEHLESFQDCVERELAEECGIKIKNLRFQFLSNVFDYDPRHYVHVGLVADWAAGEPQTLEPDKCGGWDWYAPDALPEPLFKLTGQAFESLRTGRNYFDAERR